MEKTQLLVVVLLAVGIGLMATSFGVGVAGLLGENWIDYATTTTTSTTVSGTPATIVAVIKANIGLFTTCYIVDTTTTITSIFGTSTTSLSTSDCVNSETTGYVDADTIKTIQRVGIVAGLFLGLSFVAGIIFLVLNILKKLAKPICFAAVTAPSLSFISTIMLVAALIILDGQLLAGMSMGSTATMGIVSLVLAFLATVAYSVAAAFIIKRALVASQINPNSNSKQSTSEKAEQDGSKEPEKEKPDAAIP